MRSGVRAGIAIAVAEGEYLRARRVGREAQDREAIVDDGRVGLIGAIPFEHGEFRCMQRPALAIAEDAGEIENAPLAGRQQFLAREFGRGVEIARLSRAAGRDHLRREGMQMRLVAGRDLQRAAFDLEKSARARTGSRTAALMRPRASSRARRSS